MTFILKKIGKINSTILKNLGILILTWCVQEIMLLKYPQIINKEWFSILISLILAWATLSVTYQSMWYIMHKLKNEEKERLEK